MENCLIIIKKGFENTSKVLNILLLSSSKENLLIFFNNTTFMVLHKITATGHYDDRRTGEHLT